jgi:cholesterol oxidase
MTLRSLTPSVRDATVSTYELVTEDGVTIALTRFLRAPSRDVVVLSHGLTGSTDMFVLAEHENMVSFLLDHGYTDVWSLDWRGSGRWPYNRSNQGWVFDDVALFDMPAAFAELRRHVGDARVHAFFHCAGAMCLAMSMAAGLVGGLASVTYSTSSLSARVSEVARLKILYVPEAMARILKLSHVPSDFSEIGLLSRVGLLAGIAGLSRRQCKNASCHLLNFLWGSDASTLFRHENLHPDTHQKLPQLFGPAPVSYYQQIRSMVWAEKAVRFKVSDPTYAALPTDYMASASRIDAPLLLLAADDDRLWQDSNQVFHDTLRREHPRVRVSLEVVRGYGHNDVVLGRHAAFDVFPRVLAFLRQHSQPAVAPVRSIGAAARPGGEERAALMTVLRAAFAEAFRVAPSAIDAAESISAYGPDSVLLAEIAGRLEEELGRAVPLELVFDLPSLDELADRLERPSEPRAEVVREKAR